MRRRHQGLKRAGSRQNCRRLAFFFLFSDSRCSPFWRARLLVDFERRMSAAVPELVTEFHEWTLNGNY